MDQNSNMKTIAIVGAVGLVIVIIIALVYMQYREPKKIITLIDCKTAGTNYLKSINMTPGRPMLSGDWAWVVPGCSVQSGGDWAIHWNLGTGDPNSANYTTVPDTYL